MLNSVAGRRLVGIAFLLIGGLILVVGVTKPKPFADEYVYWAEFDTAQGLGQIDRDIRVAGVKVGTMGEVVRDGDDVQVELIFEDDYTLHRDARVDMRPHTLFEGSNFVDVSPGSPSAPVLEPGATIPIEQTSNYVTLDEALRVLRPEIRTSLQDLAEVGSKTLKGDAVSGVQKTLRKAPALSKALAPAARAAQGSTRSELAGTIDGLSRTVDAVAEREGDLIPLTQRAGRTMAALTVDGGRALDAALVELPRALNELEATAPIATDLIDRLERLAVAITPALPELTLATRDAVPVLRRSIPVLLRATPIIEDARQLADRLGRAKGGLVEMFNLLPPTLRKFDRALDVINMTTAHGAPAYRQLLAAFVGFDGIFSGYQTPSQNPGAPGHALRIATYFTPDSFADLGFPVSPRTTPAASSFTGGIENVSCEEVREVSAKAADVVEREGLCE